MIPLLRRWAAKRGKKHHPATRITIISDTHWQHEQIDLPAGDLLIHCGDMFNLFDKTPNQLAAMDDWFGRQKFTQIVCTGGNHDRELETASAKSAQPFKNAHFLRDDGIRFQGLSIYGAPWVPDLRAHAFYKDSSALAKAWAKIPDGVDILVTHTPPRLILDRSSRGQSHGCQALADALPRIAPRVHCFGHIHASAGRQKIGPTLFINASSVESGTGRTRPPATLKLSPGTD